MTTRGVDDPLDRQVLAGAAERHGGVGQGDVRRAAVDVGVHRDGAHPHRLHGADDPHGDLAAVGDEHGFERRSVVVADHIRNTP